MFFLGGALDNPTLPDRILIKSLYQEVLSGIRLALKELIIKKGSRVRKRNGEKG